ncbi:MAG: MmcQ/YjbR family DNA-binding protein [Verrucomicrobiae bacterium]|nr:MmcQ/YjbR family DNA-binding protein [Verrucomicrobiae bacterium]
MDPNQLRNLLLNRPSVTEEEPFGPGVIVYKVLGKMYALSTYDQPLQVNLKCDPDRAVVLRNRHEAIEPGYHMNKKHWNTLTLDGSLPGELVEDLVRHSYELVVSGMSKKDQAKVKEASSHPSSDENNWREEFLRDMSE